MSAVAADCRDWSLYVGGASLETGEWWPVHAPYGGAQVARLAWGERADAERAIVAAAAAMRAPLAVEARAAVLRRIADALIEQREQMAEVLCREAGKPVKAGRVEVERAAGTFRHAAIEALRLAGEVVPLADGPDGSAPRVGFTLRKPIGVVAAITPFNFPLNLAAHKVAPALAAGCAVVLKPAEKAPGAARLLVQLAAEAGLPAGWLNLVAGPPEEVAGAFADDPRVGLISFTGSSRVGWALAGRAPTKRVALELGNVAPVIVGRDADLARAAEKIAAAGFGFSGQTCISVQRVLVHANVAGGLLAELTPRVEALVCGDPADPATDVGPLITAEATDRLLGWIEDARAAGARVLTGGRVEGGILLPTLVADPPAGSPLVRAEAFGPVVAIETFARFGDAIASANATDFGLQAAVFTDSAADVLRAARELRFGAVIHNDAPTFRQDHMPYGGVKLSGNTREGPARAIREMTEECLVVLDG